MNWIGIVLLAILLALAIDIGRLVSWRILGEREPLAVWPLAFVFGIAALGFFLNLLWRTTLRVDFAPVLLVPVLAVVRLLLNRWAPVAPTAPPPLSREIRMGVFALCVAATAPMVLVLRANHLWDEWDAHLPLVTSMANGVFPPVLAFMPDAPLLYHYGYDLLAALAHRLTRLPADDVLDIQTTLLFLSYMVVGAGLLRRHAGGTWSPYVMGVALAWMGGLLWLRAPFAADLGAAHLGPLVGWGDVDGYPPLPAPHSYFMQKPMALGLPLWLATLGVLLEAQRRSRLDLAVLGGFFLAFLELSQFVLFVLTAAATAAHGIVFPLLQRLPMRRSALIALVSVGTALLLASLNGGFLARPQGAPLAVEAAVRVPYFLRMSPDQGHPLSPYVWQMGLPIVLAPLAAYVAVRRKSALTIWLLMFAAISFAVPHLFHHVHSANIEKFFVTAVVGFGLLLLLLALEGARHGRPWVATVVVIVLVIGMAGNAPLWVLYFLRDAPSWSDNNPRVPNEAAAAAWLRQHADAYDRVLTSRLYVAALGGLLTPMPVRVRYQAALHGRDPHWIESTAGSVDRALRDLNADDLVRLRIRWYVRTHADEIQPDVHGLARLRDSRQFRERFALRNSDGFVEVYEYLHAAVARAVR